MKFSLTYTGAAIMILGFIFQAAGVPFAEGDAETTIKFLTELVGVVGVIYGRWRAGGVTWFGAKI